MSDANILCVGMCVLDIIHLCSEYPEEDTDKRCLNGYWQRGGNASNNCSVLSKLGAKCEFLGMTSSAPPFQFLYEDCTQRNIEIHNCPKSKMNPPFSSVILVKSKGSRTIIHANTGFPILEYKDFCKINLRKYSWIHFEGRNVEETKQMIDMIRTYNKEHCNKAIHISVELEKLNKDLYTLAMRSDVVFVGKDLAQHMGWSTAKEAVCNSLKIICDLKTKENYKDFQNPSIICPWGSERSDALDGLSNEYFSLKAVPVENIVDSLGAGDTFVAAVIYAMNNLKKNLADAVDYGNHMAAFKIQHQGYDCVENFKL